MEFKHVPVMLNECLDGLKVKANGVYFDGTLGGGGHSEEILKKCAPNGLLIATDRDDDAISSTSKRLSKYGERVKIVKSNFKEFLSVVSNLEIF